MLTCWNESVEIFPKKLCLDCVRSLGKETFKRSPAALKSHNENCRIYFTHQVSGRPEKDPKEPRLNVKTVDHLFETIGFKKLVAKDGGKDRTYVKFVDFFPEVELTTDCRNKGWSMKIYGRPISLDRIKQP